MFKINFIILISLFGITINSCSEIDRSFESANSYYSEMIQSSAYDILIGTIDNTSDQLFVTEHSLNWKAGNKYPKNQNIFLVKHNLSGNRDWIMELGLSDDESSISMTYDSSDNVYITAFTRNDLVGNNNTEDFIVFLVKYNSFGSKEWIKKLGKSEVGHGARIIADSSDNIYVTGFSSEFESDKNDLELRNTLLAKYDTLGNREWIKSLGSTLNEFAWDLTVDSKDNIHLTGFSENSFTQKNSWQDDFLLIKFNSDGIKL